MLPVNTSHFSAFSTKDDKDDGKVWEEGQTRPKC